MIKNISHLKSYLMKNEIPFVSDAPLSGYTSFKIGGPAAALIPVRCEEEFLSVLELCRQLDIKTLVMGKGSNILASDKGFSGAVFVFEKQFSRVSVLGEGLISAQAGAPLAAVCKIARDNSLSGLEFAYGIPASCGGAAAMNAGAYGGEIKDAVKHVRCVAPGGEIIIKQAEELEYGYRSSLILKRGLTATEIVFKLKPGIKNEITEKMEGIMNRRISKQPLDFPSAGSVFLRPEGCFAGELIEKAGLKGCAVGGARVSEKHAGFIINAGGATCADVLELIERVRKRVFETSGVALVSEIKIVGEQRCPFAAE